MVCYFLGTNRRLSLELELNCTFLYFIFQLSSSLSLSGFTDGMTQIIMMMTSES